MFSSRKPLAIALALVMMFAMLAPAAMAAPQWVHGVTITSPTTAAPVYVNPGGTPNSFTVKYDLTIVGTQVDDVQVRFRALDSAHHFVVWTSEIIVASNALVTGDNHMTSAAIFPWWASGPYDLEVCARDLGSPPGGAQGEWFCDVQEAALFLDTDGPGVELVKPAQGGWITGEDYLLVGKAWDPWWAKDDPLLRYGGIERTWFDYCVLSNWQTELKFCGPTDQSWITIAQGVATPGVPDQYDAIWNSTQVPDDWGVIRFCAEDLVGLMACDWHHVFVENRVTISLQAGWNLISTPLLLYDDDIADVLLHLNVDAHLYVKSVWAFDGSTWTWWQPGVAASTLSKIVDGKGYWIEMKTPANLTFVGSWLGAGGDETPPTYGVIDGWNLIGYTHFARPTALFPTSTAANYLGPNVYPNVQALLRYNPWTGYYIAVYDSQHMTLGAGYWLATTQAGTIRPGY